MSLKPEQTTSSVEVEAEDPHESGISDSWADEKRSVENIRILEPRHRLAKATKSNNTLATARAQADNQIKVK